MYRAPLDDIKFTLAALCKPSGSDRRDEIASPEIIDEILNGIAKLSENVIAPVNRVGDEQGARLEQDGVKAADGFKEAYAEFQAGGWQGICASSEWGGFDQPGVVGLAAMETVHSASMAFGLCPMLTQGAIDAIEHHASDDIKQKYLTPLVSGEWTGTMNLTEPHAGSDLGDLKTSAVAKTDGSYAIKGQKIYITWGDHDLTENIIHLVLARIDGAPEGSRGLSLFVVPKYLPDDEDKYTINNNAHAIGLEKKLGIHGSPTCTMAFGDTGETTGWLVGQENRGLACMFTMMNSARLNVGLEGVAIAERAYQQALAYAQERRQGRTGNSNSSKPVPIIRHPDIQRTLTKMRAQIIGGRGICYLAAIAADIAETAATDECAAKARRREGILIPIAKAWCTDRGVEITSSAIQVHGGMGFVEETGAAQHYRDARIAPIYEGTNGIQGIDLMMRKIVADKGLGFSELIADIRETAERLQANETDTFKIMGASLEASANALSGLIAYFLNQDDPDILLASATEFLNIAGDVLSMWVVCKLALHERVDGSLQKYGDLAASYLSSLSNGLVGRCYDLIQFKPAAVFA